jgi:Tol biopolymer transport system component
VLVEGAQDQVPMSWSHDGRYLIYQEAYNSVHVLDLVAGRELKEADGWHVAESGREALELSPDSRWLAYTREASGRKEVFVQRFPVATRSWQVSVGGGVSPHWSADGRELFYRLGDAVWGVTIQGQGEAIVAGHPRELFRGNFVNTGQPWDWAYDRSTDSFVLMLAGDDEVRSDRFVVWIGALGR